MSRIVETYFEGYHGLKDEEVLEYRKAHGKNTLKSGARHANWQMIAGIVTEPMFILLLVACSIYWILGEWTEGLIMMVALIFVSGISLYQMVRSKNAMEALHKISRTKVKVIRNDQIQQIDREDLVLNDMLLVEEGDLIPADGIVIKTNDFSVNESILTGESFSVAKQVQGDSAIFLGTLVVSGSALLKVTQVGHSTKIGQLGISMQEISTSKSLLQRQIDRFVKSMAIFGVIAFLVVWLINYLATHQIFESLLRGLTLAMSALPEELPVAFSTFMALGAWRLLKNKVLTKQPQTVESLGAASVICLDKTGTITENKMVVERIYSLESNTSVQLQDCHQPGYQQVLEDATLASEIHPFDPMEIAIHSAYQSVTQHDLRPDLQMIHEYPLGGVPPMMTHVYLHKNQDVRIACKGSWEKVLSVCKLDADQKAQITLAAQQMAKLGMRVLGTAHVIGASRQFPEHQEDFDWNFSGLIALSDPPKKNISQVFSSFYDAGIKIKMITGDYPETAVAIAQQSGLKGTGTFLTGSEILEMDADQLSKAVQSTNIFARMFPEAKLKVINSLKSSGEVVAMTGDGVNDGPALKAADIGIAMGKRGTEIARKAAGIILLDDNLEHMVDAISAGRKIYHNLKKAFRYIITIHIPIIMVVTLPLLLGWQFPNIFNPIHVIFLELIMGPTCSIIYENEPIEPHIMLDGPRKNQESLFSWNELSVSIFQGLIISAAVLIVYQYAIFQHFSEGITRTMTFTTLIFCNTFLTLVNRSFSESVFFTLRYKNPLIPLILSITVLIWFGSVKIPGLRKLFEFENINFQLIMICLLMATVAVFWIEVVKWFRRLVKLPKTG